MAQTYIGKPISLISHSDVRYRGILAGIDQQASTIQLSNVYSMGTEDRRPSNQFIPPNRDPYEYIIFRASEVKDLSVDEPMTTHSVHDDPAVVGASAPISVSPAQPSQPAPAGQQQQQHPPAQQHVQHERGGPPNVRHTANQARTNNSIHSATASLETVERALGDLRVSSAQAANGRNSGGGGNRQRRNGAPAAPVAKPEVPTTDFDFESSNARFDKAALAKRDHDSEGEDGDRSKSLSDAAGVNGEEKPATNGTSTKDGGAKSPAYDPKSSFFDTLSPGLTPPVSRGGGRGGRGVRGRGSSFARTRREEERQRNVATFGEPGGVGLLGPNAYVGGWGRGFGSGSGRGRSRNAAPVVSGTA